MARKPPKSPEQRLARWSRSMAPGTLNGRVASATPLTVDVTRLAPRLRQQQPTGGGFDPNEDPVIIGVSATAGGGSTPSDVSAGLTGSVAIGQSATASGADSTALGMGTNTESSDSTAVGHNAHTQGARDVAIGYGSKSSAAAPFNSDPGFNNIAIGFSASAGSQNGDPSCIAIGDHASATVSDAIAIGHGASTDGVGTVAIGHNSRIFGASNTAVGEWTVVDLTSASAGGTSVECTVIGYSATCHSTRSTAIGSTAQAGNPFASSDRNTAIGYNTRAQHVQSTALGANAVTNKDHQLMLGTNTDFVEIPGDSSVAPNGLVLTDTATGTRYIVQITSGALVLSAAP